MKTSNKIGHLAALVTVLIWGTTYISTKVLLQDFKPVEILFFRFVIGFAALLSAKPQRLKLTDKKQEVLFALAGLCGVCLYSLLENIALTYTMASNVGVIISAAPFFTAIMTRLLMKGEEKLRANFFVGFAAAMVGDLSHKLQRFGNGFQSIRRRSGNSGNVCMGLLFGDYKKNQQLRI